MPDTVFESLIPRGVKDFLPLKAAEIAHLTRSILDVFGQWGFRPIVPPSLEYLDVLERGLGAGLRDRTFRFDDRQDGKLVAFPPDITPQVARIVATRMREMPLPLRLCYSGRVLRHAEQQTGKDREIFQAGVELIGLESPEADAEMVAMAVEALTVCGATDFTIDIGQVEFFRGIMADLPLADNIRRQLQDAIARKDTSAVRRLIADAPLSDATREEILALPRLFGGREVLGRAEQAVSNDRSRRALDNLARVLDHLSVYGVERYITLDLGELRGLDYHTGITFQGFVPGVGRAVCLGGRYDQLTARYGYPAPATGFAFDLLNLLFALDGQHERGGVTATDVLIFQAGADKSTAQRVARSLRRSGKSAARDIIARELPDTLDYARKMHFRFVMVIDDTADSVRLIDPVAASERRFPLRAVLDGEIAL